MPSSRGHDGDSGVGRRMAGTFMTQMQDIKEDVFWVFTSNDVDTLHEAFLADDRVDAVVYVGMPDAAQRAAGWKMYLRKFFPKKVKGEAFPRHLPTKISDLVEEWNAAETWKTSYWVDRIVAAMMCLLPRERAALLDANWPFAHDLEDAVKRAIIEDEGWTVARIKACCRMARKRGRSLTEIARSMPREEKKLEGVIARLETWATQEAVDAATGVAYVPKQEYGASVVVNAQRRTKRIKTV